MAHPAVPVEEAYKKNHKKKPYRVERRRQGGVMGVGGECGFGRSTSRVTSAEPEPIHSKLVLPTGDLPGTGTQNCTCG